MTHQTLHQKYSYVYLPENIVNLFCNMYLPYYEEGADRVVYPVAEDFANTDNLNAEEVTLMFENDKERLFGLPNFEEMTPSVQGIMAQALNNEHSANFNVAAPAQDGKRTDLQPASERSEPAKYMPFCTHIRKEFANANANRYIHRELFDIRNYMGFYKQYVQDPPDSTKK